MAVDTRSLPDRIRHRFPILASRVYLNSCSQGALSDAVRDAYARYLEDWDARGSPWDYWVERMQAARWTFAGLVNAHPDEVAVTTSVSAGVSALASGLPFDRGRSKVVVSDFEFPTIGQIWHAQELRGARVVHVPEADDGTIPLERFDEAIDEDTLLVSVTQVCFRNGGRLDVEGVVRLAHERGALVLLDSYQALGAIPVDVKALGVDLLAGGVLKYLLGSAGLAFLYCRRDLVEHILPTATGWFADEDIFRMDIHDYSPARTARRFEAGTPPVPNIYAGIAGIELMQEIGIAETQVHVGGLTDALIEGVEELGGRVVTPQPRERRGPLVAIRSTDEHALVTALEHEGVVTSSRDGNLRVSPHCYNTMGDIEALLDRLARHRHLLVQDPRRPSPQRAGGLDAASDGRRESPMRTEERGGAMGETLGDLIDALSTGSVEVVDLTQPLSERTPIIQLPEPFANTPPLRVHEISRFDDRGPAWYWNWMELGEHHGTHLDAPAHWISGRDLEDVSQVPVSRLIGPAVVIDKVAEVAENPDYLLTVDEIKAFEAEHGPLPEKGWLLYRTGWDARAHDQEAFLNADEAGPHTPGMEVDCARWLAEEAPIVGVGVETVGTDAGTAHSFEPPFPCHYFMLGAGKYGLTQLANLAQLPPVGAVLIVSPLKLERGSGSPARAMALVPR